VSSTAFANIGSLVTNDESLGVGERGSGGSGAALSGAKSAAAKLGERSNAGLVVEHGRVVWVGDSADLPDADSRVDVGGCAVIPGFVDSHAHLMFAGDRAAEFSARMEGKPYSAGGIKTTVAATRAATDDQLAENLLRLVAEMHASGITTFETKSGYGLTVEDEARALRIASAHTSETTFLGAHVVPAEFAGRGPGSNGRSGADDYVSLVVGEMLSAAARHSKWIDVFCDRGAFDVDQTREILTAGIGAGLKPRIHANQLSNIGAIELAVELDCASADHCTHLSERDIELLAGSNTVAALLPGAEFSTRSPYPDARRLIDAGATVALATDCNPGSSYTTSMPFCIAVAVREMHMSPAEALWSATAGGAAALRRTDVGHLGLGAAADFVILNAPSHQHLAYRPGVNLIGQTWLGGKLISPIDSSESIGQIKQGHSHD
jgi:imidazolonepropionase